MTNNVTCFFADGIVSNDIFCGLPGMNVCCGSGWDCLTNGLCRQHGTTQYSQGTCSDKDYLNCSAVCDQAQYGHNTKIERCDSNGNEWCCGADSSQGQGCCSSNRRVALRPFPFQTMSSSSMELVASSATSRSVVQSTSAISPPSSNIVRSHTPPTTTSQIKSPSTSYPVELISSQPVGPPPTPQPTEPSDGSRLATQTGASIGGIGFAVIVTAVVVFIIYQRIKKRRNMALAEKSFSRASGTTTTDFEQINAWRLNHNTYMGR